MNFWSLIFLWILGCFILHIGSFFMIEMEKGEIPDENLYFGTFCFVLFGIYLAVISTIKLYRWGNERTRQNFICGN